MELINVLNLGAGVQSSAVLLMSLKGELPPLDWVVFADTGWEPEAVYRQLDWLEEQASKKGVKIHRVKNGNIKEDALISQVRGLKGADNRWASLPYHVMNQDGSGGIIRRQCTAEYKIVPIERFIRSEILGLKKGQHAPKVVTIKRWYGISFDEMQRMKISAEKWAENWYPLVEMKMSRSACHAWMDRQGLHESPRSACIGCPFHTNREWRYMKENRPMEWEEAVEFDKSVRKCGGERGDVYIHHDRIPLDQVNLYKDYDKNQLPLFDMNDECAGMCGV